MDADREEQEDELLALCSIFESEEFVRDESNFAGEIRVSVELPADFTVALKEGERQRQYDISFLPPLHLTFELPEDYPSSSPPSFTLTCSWLTHTQLSALTAQLIDLYQATGGAVVLFTWIQFLKEDALKFLDIHALLELPSDELSDFTTPSVGAENVTGILGNGQDPEPSQVSDEESQEAEEFIQNGLNPEEEILIQETAADAESQPDQKQENSESKGVSEHNQEDILNGGDSSASSLSSSSSPHPPCASGQSESASLPVHPNMSPQNERKTSSSGLSLTPSQALMSQILIYNAAQKQKEFATTVFDCGVCYIGWLGSECIELLGCGHIFCRGCLGEFCKVQITEGNVKGVTCPNAGCPATPTQAQVQSLVGEELFSRYDRLLLQMTLDSMPDVIYCPRRTCAAAVISEKSSRAAMCSVCNFAFCVACKKTYHGPDDCQKKNKKKAEEEEEEEEEEGDDPLPQSEEGIKALWEDYSTGSRQRRRFLESRYGRYRLLFSVAEDLSESWKDVNTKYCPHCFCRIQKHGGCKMMYCTQCERGFCWNCQARELLSDTPSHNPESCCMSVS